MIEATKESDIVNVIDRWKAAICGKDAAAVMRCYSKEIIAFGLAPPLREAVGREGLDAWFATWVGPLQIQTAQQSVCIGGDIAYVASIEQISGKKVGGEQVGVWTRATRGLRRIDGEWKISHEHTSVPFYMDGSLRAAVDLTP
jgi:PhnB protein